MRMARPAFPSRLSSSSPEWKTNIERPGYPSATTVAPAAKRLSTSMEIRRLRLASGRPPKKGVATRNAFRSGELTAIHLIYFGSGKRAKPDGTHLPRIFAQGRRAAGPAGGIRAQDTKKSRAR